MKWNDLRETHPNLYRAYMVYAFTMTALGLNLLFLTPAFNPLDIPKWVFGVIFLVLGAALLVFLNLVASLRLLRMSMAATISLLFFYGGLLIYEFFRLEQTSLQLPITYIGLATLALPLLAEPFRNPITDKRNNGNGVNGNGGD